jgi:hypothetical protein
MPLTRLPTNISPALGSQISQIHALYKQAGLASPSEEAVLYYLNKGTSGLDLLKKNLAKDKRTSFYQAPTTGGAPPTPAVSEDDQLRTLIQSLTPKPVDEATLTGRFSSLFDPTFQANEQDINKELDLRLNRFTEDQGVSADRLRRSRALEQGQAEEQLAAGGASGQLASAFTQRRLDPYDDSAQDAGIQAGRFSTDLAEERRRRLLQNKQSRSRALAGYVSDPANTYEFSY